MLCMWWFERFINGKDEREVIHIEYIHVAGVCDSERTVGERVCCCYGGGLEAEGIVKRSDVLTRYGLMVCVYV